MKQTVNSIFITNVLVWILFITVKLWGKWSPIARKKNISSDENDKN
jgi:hypothetical protein